MTLSDGRQIALTRILQAARDHVELLEDNHRCAMSHGQIECGLAIRDDKREIITALANFEE
ncbi:MAG: hypothetical protein V3S12_01245 [Acidiferrobacterales bacterium]